MVGHLFWQDVKHNLRPIRTLPVLAVAIYLAYREVCWHKPLGSQHDYEYFAEGAFSRNNFWLSWVIPLIAGVMGGSLAAERRAGVTLSVLAKGVAPSRYVVAKMLAAATSSAIVTLSSIAFFFAYVFINWIPGCAPHIKQAHVPGPVESLYLYNPFLHDLLAVSMLVAASAALPLVGVIAGLLVANEYVAMAATPIYTVIFTVLMRKVSGALVPDNYLGLHYEPYVPASLIPLAPFLYWTVFSLIIAGLCRFIFTRKEIA